MDAPAGPIVLCRWML